MQAKLEKPKVLWQEWGEPGWGTKSLCIALCKTWVGQVCISYLVLIKCTKGRCHSDLVPPRKFCRFRTKFCTKSHHTSVHLIYLGLHRRRIWGGGAHAPQSAPSCHAFLNWHVAKSLSMCTGYSDSETETVRSLQTPARKRLKQSILQSLVIASKMKK